MKIFVLTLNVLFGVSMPFTHIGGYVTAGLAFLCVWYYWKDARRDAIVMLICALVVYGLGRSFFSADPQVGYAAMFGYLGHWLVPYILGLAARSEQDVKRALGAYAAAMTVLVGVSVLAYIGFLPHVVGNNYVLVEDSLLKAMRSHIALAALCLMITFVFAAQALVRTELSLRNRAVFLSGAIAYATVLFLTGSRGYYLAAVASFALFGIAWASYHRRWAVLATGIVAGTTLLAGLYFFTPTIKDRMHRTSAQDPNVVERLMLYRVALWEVKARPVTGFGPGQGIHQQEFFLRLPAEWQSVSRHPHLHSFYLNLAADFGLTGFAIFAALFAVMLTQLWRVSASGAGFLPAAAAGLFCGIVGVLFGDCFDTLLRGPGVAMELFWAAGLVLGAYRSKSNGVH